LTELPPCGISEEVTVVSFELVLIIQYFLRSFRGTGTWTKCRSRHKIETDWQKTSSHRPNKGYDRDFAKPVLDQLVSISAYLVPGPALCPGDGAAERPQEILYY